MWRYEHLQQKGGTVEKPVWKEYDPELMKKESRPVIDVTYVELPERLTYRFDASYVLGAAAVLAMIAATGAAEENPLLSFICTAVFAVCAHLSIREDGKRK